MTQRFASKKEVKNARLSHYVYCARSERVGHTVIGPGCAAAWPQHCRPEDGGQVVQRHLIVLFELIHSLKQISVIIRGHKLNYSKGSRGGI